jgi:hypothetical protein
MKNINNYFFIWAFVFYLVITYFFFPYLSSTINQLHILKITKQYIFVVLFPLSVFLIIFFLINNFCPIKKKAVKHLNQDNHNILILAYILFILGFISKLQNILRGNHENFLYSDINSKFFLFEYFASMNAFSLLSIFFFINIFYNRQADKNINLLHFLLPVLYFILYILFSPGGRVNLGFILFIVLYFETIKFINFKLYLFKISLIFIIFSCLFVYIKTNKDVTVLNLLKVHVFDSNKQIYFSDLDTNQRGLYDVLLSKNLKFFTCKKILSEYEDKTDFSYYKICNHSYGNVNANNKFNNEKRLTLDNGLNLYNAPTGNIFSYIIYNFSARFNNNEPLYRLLNLLNDQKLNERPLDLELKKLVFSYTNKFLIFFTTQIIYERNLQVDNFNILSGITIKSSEAGLSPTLIGEIYWIGGYYFLFFYFIKISLFIYLLNYLFIRHNIFYKILILFFFMNYVLTFESSFESHIGIIFNNLLLIFLCIILFMLIKKLSFYYKKN